MNKETQQNVIYQNLNRFTQKSDKHFLKYLFIYK